MSQAWWIQTHKGRIKCNPNSILMIFSFNHKILVSKLLQLPISLPRALRLVMCIKKRIDHKAWRYPRFWRRNIKRRIKKPTKLMWNLKSAARFWMMILKKICDKNLANAQIIQMFTLKLLMVRDPIKIQVLMKFWIQLKESRSKKEFVLLLESVRVNKKS